MKSVELAAEADLEVVTGSRRLVTVFRKLSFGYAHAEAIGFKINWRSYYRSPTSPRRRTLHH
jgi:hypothetical protein